VISTTDSALAWSRLTLRRGSEETMVFLFFIEQGEKKQKGKKSLPVFHSFVSLSFFVCTPLSFSLSLSREERDNRRGGRRSISLPLSRSLLSPITSF